MRFANLDGRLALASRHGYIDVARASGDQLPSDPMAALDQWDGVVAWASSYDTTEAPAPHVAASGSQRAPVPWPRQVFGIGLNYNTHVAESGFTAPEHPAVFTKFPTSITGPQSPVPVPLGSVDWEVELVVVLGRRAERVAESDAWDYVAGVTVGQDISERDLQLSGPAPQFSLGKSFPGFSPIGPELVTVDELQDRDNVALGCELEGGEVLQNGNTSDLIFTVPALISKLSAILPLLPGDLIFTGTPSGIGFARDPQKFLVPGDVLVSWIDGVGSLRNPMVAQDAASVSSITGEPVGAASSHA